MTNILSGLIGTKTLIYLDAIVIWGATLQEHNARLRVHSLRLQPDKCEFLGKEVCYLGHKITPEGIKPDKGNDIKPVACSPQANYTDRATAACRRS
jgi:hypothetical protein